MSGVAVAPAAPVSPISPAKAPKLDGTVAPGALDVTLPSRPEQSASPLDLLKAKIPQQAVDAASKLADVEKFQLQLKNTCHFLTAREFAACRDSMLASREALNKALAAGDAAAYLRELTALHTLLKRLHDFVAYEKSQGLVGTVSGCGVRIYFKDDRVWLCTPDAKAFSELTPEEKEELGSFVKGVTGIEVDFNQASFQHQGQSGQIQLLGCRLDPLKLKQQPQDQKYTLDTKVRSDAGEYTYQRISFTWADLTTGNIPGLINGNKQLPDAVFPGSAMRAWFAGAPPEHFIENALLATPQIAKSPLLPSRSARAAAGKLRTAGLPATETPDAKVLRERFELRSKLKPKPSPADLAAHLDELGKSQAAFDKAAAAERKRLNEEIRKATGNSAEYRRATGELARLNRVHAEDVLLRKTVLQHQAAGSGAAVQEAAKSKLVKMAAEVDRAYQRLLANPDLDPATRGRLEANRGTFHTEVAACKPPPGRARAALAKVTGAVRSLVPGKLGEKLSALGNVNLRPKIPSWTPYFGSNAVLKDALITADRANTEAAAAKEPGLLTAKERAKELRALDGKATKLRAQIKLLDEARRAGDNAKAAELAKLREADARVSIRRGGILEAQLKDAATVAEQQRLKDLLAASSADIDYSYRLLKLDIEADDFAARRRTEAGAADRKKLIDANRGNPKLDAASAELAKAEKALAKAASGSPEHAILKAATRLYMLEEDIALAELKLAACEEKSFASPEDAKLRADVKAADEELVRLRRNHCRASLDYLNEQLKPVDARLSDIDAELKKPDVDAKTKAKLERERTVKLDQKSKLAAKLDITEAKGPSDALEVKVNRQRLDLEQVNNSAAAQSDPVKKAQLEREAAKLKRELLRCQDQFLSSELSGARQARERLARLVGDVDDKINELRTANHPAEIEKYQALKTKLERRLQGAANVEQLLESQKKLIGAERRAHHHELAKKAVQADLDALSKAPTPDAAKVAAKTADLKVADENLIKAQEALKNQQTETNKLMAEKLKAAKQNFLTKVRPGLEEMARKHPMKAAGLAAAFTEAFRTVTTASYDRNAKHTYLPALATLLDSNLEDGFFGSKAMWTTEELGLLSAVGVEFVRGVGSGASNVALIYTGLKGSQLVCGGTLTKVAKQEWKVFSRAAGGVNFAGRKGLELLASKASGRLLGFAGAGMDGYLTFADYNSWKDSTDLQLFGKTASPVATGATFGAFFGPPGALLGALGGAAGELGGLIHACRKLDREIALDWQKRGVRESIRLAENGYIYPDGHPALAGHNGELSEAEQAAIHDMNKAKLLQQMFGPQPVFAHAELSAMGFRLDNSAEAGAHNAERLEQLLEQPFYRWIWNPFRKNSEEIVWSNHSYDLLHGPHAHLGHKLHALRGEWETKHRELYRKAPRVRYTNHQPMSTLESIFSTSNDGGKATVDSELGSYFNEAIAFYKAEAPKIQGTGTEACEARWQLLREKFPELGLILAAPHSRQMFFARFKAQGVDLEASVFWTHRGMPMTDAEVEVFEKSGNNPEAIPLRVAFVERIDPAAKSQAASLILDDGLSGLDTVIADLERSPDKPGS